MVHNDENAYTGENTLINATAYSDNSIYAEVGLKVGTHRIAALAHRMGITTPISTNPAMTIGGLQVGVTPLDMAHAYETIAHGGERVAGTLGEPGMPVGIEEVNAGGRTLPDGQHREVDRTLLHSVLPAQIASTETEMLETVLSYGTARSAALGQFAAGKTGTTSNYGDAWFVGWDSRFTVAVWVGFPNRLIPMTTEFDGGPVLGGTFPALIWHSFMVSAMQVEKQRTEEADARHNAAKAARAAAGTSTAAHEEAAGASTSTTTGSSTAPAQEPARAPKIRGGSTAPHPARGGTEKTANPGGAEGGAGAPNQSPPASAPAPATSTPAAPAAPATPGVTPGATPAPAAAAPKVSGGTGAPTGGAGPAG